MRLTSSGIALVLVMVALGAGSVLLHDFLVEATLGVLLVVIAAEAVWVTLVARAPEKRVQLAGAESGGKGGERVVLYPGDESVREAHLIKRIGGTVDLESPVNFQTVAPKSVAGQAGTAQLELRFSTPYAGDYAGQKMKVRVTGPLNLFSSETSIPFLQEYVVYPRTMQVAMATLKLLGRGELGETPIDMPGIGTEFYEMRAYQAGDDYRNVNWSASARLGEIVVAEHMREVGGSYLLVLDTRAEGFAEEDRLASTFLSLANSLADSGASFGVLVHDGQRVAEVSRGDSPRGSLEIALRAALYQTKLEGSPEILELMPQRVFRGPGIAYDQDTTLQQLLRFRNEQVRELTQNVDPWATALRYIDEKSVRNVLWVSELPAGVEPLIELAWQARHHHDTAFVVANPRSSAEASEGSSDREKLIQALSAAGVQLFYGEPLTVAQRVLSG
jgi:uncharacterized protein (DUF58 family)